MLEEVLLFNAKFKSLVRELLEDPSIDKFWDLLYEVDAFAEKMAHGDLRAFMEEAKVKGSRRDILLSTYTLSSLIAERVKEDIEREISRL